MTAIIFLDEQKRPTKVWLFANEQKAQEASETIASHHVWKLCAEVKDFSDIV